MKIIKHYEETLISNNYDGDHIQIIKYNIITDFPREIKTENCTLSVKFEINIIINILETRVDKIPYIYVGVRTKLHVSVVESGLYMEKESVETKVELDGNVYKNSWNQIEVDDDDDGEGVKMKPETKLIA